MASLSATSNGTSGQSTTQSPQAATPFTGITADGNKVQPGTPTTSLDSGTGGVPLTSNTLPSVSISTRPTGSVATAPVHHGINPVLAVFAIVLFAAAIALFVSTMRDDKTTTA